MSEETPIPVEKSVWYKNVTLWTNVVAVVAIILNNYFGIAIDPKLQAGILAIINLVLQTPNMATTQAKADAHNKGVRAKMVS
jgi:hypothetical protein